MLYKTTQPNFYTKHNKKKFIKNNEDFSKDFDRHFFISRENSFFKLLKII